MTSGALHPSVVALRRRQRAGAVNRRVGWVLLPVMIAATAVHYLPGERTLLAAALVVLVVGLNTTHLALSVYVFGFVRPRRTLKVFHIYFGYALGLVIWASQTNLRQRAAAHLPDDRHVRRHRRPRGARHPLRGPAPGRVAGGERLAQRRRMRTRAVSLALVSRKVVLTAVPP